MTWYELALGIFVGKFLWATIGSLVKEIMKTND
jgi:hypothetical protein